MNLPGPTNQDGHLYQIAFDQAAVPLLILDAQLRIVAANLRAASLCGFTPEELKGRSAKAIFSAASVEWLSRLLLSPHHKETFTTEFEIVGAEASRAVQTAIVSLAGSPQEPLLIVSLEAVAVEADRCFDPARLADLTQDALIVRDLEDRVIFWNRSAERLYGWSASEALGQNLYTLLSPGCSWPSDEVNAALAEKGEWSGELRQTSRDGHEITVASRWILWRDESDQPQAVAMVSTDITEKKRLETLFLRAQRMDSLGRLTSGVAHDLNNVLAPMLMALHGLQQKYVDQASQRWLNILLGNTERAEQLVTHLLEFARGGSGLRAPIQLRRLIIEQAELLKATLPQRITIRIQTDDDLWLVAGHATQLYQALLNLCLNARDAMIRGGELIIRAENVEPGASDQALPQGLAPGRYVRLSVADTGVGIEDALIGRIFEPFFTTRNHQHATGLGLTTVQEIIRNHGGVISLHSQAGLGTRFDLWFPALAGSQPVQEQQKITVSPQAGRGELILVAAGAAAFREITRDILELSGYRAATAASGAEALSLCQNSSHEIRAILLDADLPDPADSQLLTELKRLNPEIAVIFLGAEPGVGLRAEPGSRPKTVFLPRPCPAEQLLRALAELPGQRWPGVALPESSRTAFHLPESAAGIGAAFPDS
jgi:PAS domain S-box-containing protein